MAENETARPEPPAGEPLLRRIFRRNFSNDRRSVIGTVLFTGIVLLVAWVAVNEPQRMRTFTAQYQGRSIERGAVIFASNCSSCHGRDGKGLTGIAPALNAPDLFDGSRLAAVGWTGTLYDYVYLTVAAGRPVMSASYPQPMPTWSQEYGGPMRPDEVRDVVAYVMNYALFYEEGYGEGGAVPVLPTPTPLAYEPIGINLTSELPPGDAARGERLFLGAELAPDGTMLACQTCHSLDGSVLVGPSLQGIAQASRVPAGYASVEAYIRESILAPEAYEVPGYEQINMVANFGQRLDAQSLADLIAYLLTLD